MAAAMLSGCSLTQYFVREADLIVHTVEPTIHQVDDVLLDIEHVLEDKTDKTNQNN